MTRRRTLAGPSDVRFGGCGELLDPKPRLYEVDLRREAVRRRQAGETTGEVAEALGHSARWVRKGTARHAAAERGQDWAASVSRAPHRSPNRTGQVVRDQVLAVRAKLEVNPQSQYGPLAIACELQLLGVDPVPEVWTISRILSAAEPLDARCCPKPFVTCGNAQAGLLVAIRRSPSILSVLRTVCGLHADH